MKTTKKALVFVLIFCMVVSSCVVTAYAAYTPLFTDASVSAGVASLKLYAFRSYFGTYSEDRVADVNPSNIQYKVTISYDDLSAKCAELNNCGITASLWRYSGDGSTANNNQYCIVLNYSNFANGAIQYSGVLINSNGYVYTATTPYSPVPDYDDTEVIGVLSMIRDYSNLIFKELSHVFDMSNYTFQVLSGPIYNLLDGMYSRIDYLATSYEHILENTSMIWDTLIYRDANEVAHSWLEKLDTSVLGVSSSLTNLYRLIDGGLYYDRTNGSHGPWLMEIYNKLDEIAQKSFTVEGDGFTFEAIDTLPIINRLKVMECVLVGQHTWSTSVSYLPEDIGTFVAGDVGGTSIYPYDSVFPGAYAFSNGWFYDDIGRKINISSASASMITCATAPALTYGNTYTVCEDIPQYDYVCSTCEVSAAGDSSLLTTGLGLSNIADNTYKMLDSLDNLTVTVDLDTSDIARALYIGGDGKHTFTTSVSTGSHTWDNPQPSNHDWQLSQHAVNENLLQNWYFGGTEIYARSGSTYVGLGASYGGVLSADIPVGAPTPDGYYEIVLNGTTWYVHSSDCYQKSGSLPINSSSCITWSQGIIFDNWGFAVSNADTLACLNSSGLSVFGSSAVSQSFGNSYYSFGNMPFVLSALHFNGKLDVVSGVFPITEPSLYQRLCWGDGLILDYVGSGLFSFILQRASSDWGSPYVAVKFELGSQQTLAHQDASGNWVLNYTPSTPADLSHTQSALYTCSHCGETSDSPDYNAHCSAVATYSCSGCDDTFTGSASELPASGCAANATTTYICTACGKHYDIGPGDVLNDTRCYAAAPGQTLAQIANGISYKLDNLPSGSGSVGDLSTVETTLSNILNKLNDINGSIDNLDFTVDVTNPAYDVFYVDDGDDITEDETIVDLSGDVLQFGGKLLGVLYRVVFVDAMDSIETSLTDFEDYYTAVGSNGGVNVWD